MTHVASASFVLGPTRSSTRILDETSAVGRRRGHGLGPAIAVAAERRRAAELQAARHLHERHVALYASDVAGCMIDSTYACLGCGDLNPAAGKGGDVSEHARMPRRQLEQGGHQQMWWVFFSSRRSQSCVHNAEP